MMRFYGLNRTYCDVLHEMRQLLKHEDLKAGATFTSLVEELQVFGSRMEAALSDLEDLEKLHKQIKKLKKEATELGDRADDTVD